MTNYTASNVALALPYQTCPLDNLPPAAKAIETLLAVYFDDDDERLVEVVHNVFRPDLTHAELFEHIERLAALSADAASWQNQLARRYDDEHDCELSPSRAFEAAAEAYATHLIKFATRPSDFAEHADQAVAIVDELAARRTR